MAEQEKSGIKDVFIKFASSKSSDKRFKKALEDLSKGDFSETIKNLDQKSLQEFLLFKHKNEKKEVSENASVDAGSASSRSHHDFPMSKSVIVQPSGRSESPKKPNLGTTYINPGRQDTARQSSANRTREQQSHDVDSLKKSFPSSDWQDTLKDIQEHFEKLDKRCKQLQEESPKANSSKKEENKQTRTQNKQPGAKETVKQSDVDLKSYLLKLQEHLVKRDKVVDDLDAENKEICDKFTNLQKVLEQKEKEANEKAMYMGKFQEMEKERNESIEQLSSLRKDNEQREKDATERANNIEKSLNDQYHKLVKAEHDKEKAEAEASQLLKDNNKNQGTIKKLQDDIQSLQTVNGTLMQDVKKLEYNLQKIKDESVRKLDHLKDEFENERRSLNKKLQEMEKEKNEFRDRFSKIAGQKLVEKNADIADLSDPNRAMKLSERFGQIYDDDWTDAFQALTDRKMQPKDAIMVLMEILKKCYQKCEEVAAIQLEGLKGPLIQPVRFVEEVSKVRAGIKEKPRISTKHEKMLKDARRQMWDASVGTVTQLMMAELKDWLKKDVGPKAFEDTKVYIEKCAETCWLSVLHDPPIYLKTDTKEGEKLDINLYTAYSASGEKIDYLVWPPLFNGKEGGLLSKGVAEPLRTVKKK